MPRRKGLKARMTPVHKETIIPAAVNSLTLEERAEFRALLLTPLMQRVWFNARASKPGVFNSAQLNTPIGSVIANNRFHEIRGWEMFEAAIIGQINDPKPVAKPPLETYPDSGVR